MDRQPVTIVQDCELCDGPTPWVGDYGEQFECVWCGNTDEPYDPFEAA